MVYIYSRGEWGARYSDGAGYASIPASEVWLHHTVTKHLSANASIADEKEQMRVIESIGQSRFGAGISYTWLIFPSGRIYQGHSVNRIGYHTGGRNHIARAICLPGNYEANPMTNQQVASAARLLQYAQSKNWIKYARLNGGHRDVKGTSCPGINAYRRISEVNNYKEVVTQEEEEEVKPKIRRIAGYESVFAVTPAGHFHLKSMDEVRAYAKAWGISPEIVTVPVGTDKSEVWGPRLDL